jgi:hypothetical protein
MAELNPNIHEGKTSDIDELINKIEKIDINNNINPSQILIDIIKIQKEKEDNLDIWKNSIYKDIAKLESNNVGIVGESLIQNICKSCDIISDIDGAKTKEVGGGKNGDGSIKNKSVEIKTARLGTSKSSPSFQHELGEHPWNSEYMIFIDISPNDIYITIFKNFSEQSYTGKDFLCVPYFPTKTVTRRKGIGNFKLDTTVKINEECVKNGYSIKFKDNINEIKDFINRTIL